jgi:MoxR-like ATPase
VECRPLSDATVFADTAAVNAALEGAGYLSSTEINQVVYLAHVLGKPLLVEGPAGVGKTGLALAIAGATERPLIRLQCYEGLDEAKALYEWNYRKQLLRLQADPERRWDEVEEDIFGESFLITRPLLAAITSPEPVVLLIDEVDRLEIETEALLLELLAEFQVTIPELGTMTAATMPVTVLTSNNSRELSEALKRRCLFLHLDYPTIERERAILNRRVPELDGALAAEVTRVVRSLRGIELRKPPSISESIDWARTLVALGIEHLTDDAVADTLGVLLKYQADIEAAIKSLDDDA